METLKCEGSIIKSHELHFSKIHGGLCMSLPLVYLLCNFKIAVQV